MKKYCYRLMSVASVAIWGSSFFVSKELLNNISAVKLMFVRFVIGYLALLAINHDLKLKSKRDEWYFFLIGLVGCSFYYLCENYALNFTYSSNVSIVVATSPLVTILLNSWFYREKLSPKALAGFVIAIVGVVFVVLNGAINLKLNPVGDLLAFGASVCWGFYSILLKKVMGRYEDSYIARKIIFYGMLTGIPILLLDRGKTNIEAVLSLGFILPLLYLGIISTAVAFIWWDKANNKLGIVEAGGYVYFAPVVTLICGVSFLKEKVTVLSVIGILLILSELKISGEKVKITH